MRWAVVILTIGVVLNAGKIADMIPEIKPSPKDPVDPSVPAAPEELAVSVKGVLADATPEQIELCAGWLLAMADTLRNGDEPIARLRTAWTKAKQSLGIATLLGDVAGKHLEPFAGTNPDRLAHAKALEELASACMDARK